MSSPNNQDTGVSQEVRNQLTLLLSRSGLPRKLVDRCLHDVDGHPHYRRVAGVHSITARAPNSSYWGSSCACCCNCSVGFLIDQGKLGKLKDNDQFVFLAPGYHTISTLGQEMLGEVSTTVYNQAVIHGSAGFVVITEGSIGVLLVGAEFRLLAPGCYEWRSPAVQFMSAVDVTRPVAKLGPFSLVTVPEGNVAITYHNGDLRILGLPGDNGNTKKETNTNTKKEISGGGAASTVTTVTEQRTYFLDDPKWLFSSFLTLKTQTDRLEGNDLLSSDAVEIIMTSLAEWRIVDPVLAVTLCGDDMETVRVKVDALVRATIARIVSATAIGHNVSGATSNRNNNQQKGGNNNKNGNDDENAGGVHHEEADLSHLMQSDQALLHMKELTLNFARMGIEVVGVYVPEKRIKNDDTRVEIARQAVIGIRAEAERAAADAKAYAIVTNARAEAEAISELARAHSDAGKRLGAPTETAARMALSEITAKALKDAKVTLFSGAPDKMPFLFSGEKQ